VLFSK